MSSTFIQIVLNGLVAASIWTVLGIGFGWILAITGFFHFAHAAVFTFGAYGALVATQAGLPIVPAILVGGLLGALLGGLLEKGIYRTLRRRGTASLVSLLASLGLYVLIQNLISLIFGDRARVLPAEELRSSIELGGVWFTQIQLWIILTAIFLTIGAWFFLQHTKYGLLFRAIADNASLAKLTGLITDRIILLVVILVSGAAAILGALVAIDVDMKPGMGMNPLMLAVVVALVGGRRHPLRIAAAAGGLALLQQLAAWFVGNQWQEAVAFVFLGIFLALEARQSQDISVTTEP